MTGVSRSKVAACFVAVLLLTIWRAPYLLSEPRFWAEDGTMYFFTPYHSGVWAGLFSPHDGYFALTPNIAGTISALLPLEYAPYGTTLTGLLVQLLISSLLIFGRSPLWDTFPKKLLLSSGVLFLAPGEIWLNTNSSQHWFCLAAFILLMEPKADMSRLRRNSYRAILLVAGLTSITALFLLPCFLLKAWWQREREERVHLGILSGVALLHLFVLFFSAGQGQHLANRFGSNEFVLIDVLLFNFVYPFFSKNLFRTAPVESIDWWFFGMGKALFGEPTFDWLRFSEVVLTGGMIAWFLFAAWRNRRDRGRQLIISSFLMVALLSTLLSVKMANGPRYAFAPSFMLLVLITCELFGQAACWWKRVTMALFLGFITLSQLDYRTNRYCFDPGWPKWRDELALWRTDPGYRIRIWPQVEEEVNGKWYLDLAPRQNPGSGELR